MADQIHPRTYYISVKSSTDPKLIENPIHVQKKEARKS